ncbi:Apoptosis-inducing factor 1 [Vanrija pseudolonga]|uniref:Apoptosis-inducing factor 1 n=1 Tax=Vanrija pseudolonga TaxID=143232 RepID=A0AAF0YIR9_9TREE|nr:Apoptosis-inducing factor 1 [Vanrija pseudolonga]
MILGLRRTSLLPLRRIILTPTVSPARILSIPRYYSTMSLIKTLPVLDDKDLAEGEHKAVEFDGTKILLSRVKGEVHATSAHCTHYGAPLEKGVLDSSGRLVCPWHNACFNVTTGDIEDSPGLDSLWKYAVEIKDGKIFVSASEKEVKAKVGRVIPRARKPIAATQKLKVVIVGGGAGAIHTIESLRERDYAGDITVISAEPYAPIDRTKLSKGLVDDATKVEWRTPEVLTNDFGVELQLGTSVTAIDTQAQTVTTDKGASVKYDHLVLAPGSIPRKIPIPGIDLDGVVTIRHTSDVKAVNDALGPDADVVIIGTSFIGIEAAQALAKKEHKSLVVVGVDEVPFENILGRDVGLSLVKNLEGQGITLHRGAKIEALTASPDGKKVAGIQIKDIGTLPASVVIVGTGVRPATDFLKASSIALERDGGVTVDEYLRVAGHKNVYAIGDIAHYPQFPDGFSRRVEHWNVAGNHGREVGRTIANPDQPAAYRRAPHFWSTIGKGLRFVSTGAPSDETYFDGSAEDLKFVLYQAKGGKITTVASMGRDPIVAKASELFIEGKLPTLDEIRNGKSLLDIQT